MSEEDRGGIKAFHKWKEGRELEGTLRMHPPSHISCMVHWRVIAALLAKAAWEGLPLPLERTSAYSPSLRQQTGSRAPRGPGGTMERPGPAGSGGAESLRGRPAVPAAHETEQPAPMVPEELASDARTGESEAEQPAPMAPEEPTNNARTGESEAEQPAPMAPEESANNAGTGESVVERPAPMAAEIEESAVDIEFEGSEMSFGVTANEEEEEMGEGATGPLSDEAAEARQPILIVDSHFHLDRMLECFQGRPVEWGIVEGPSTPA